MRLLKWFVVVLTLVTAGYMVVDGINALLTGSYFTPSEGEYAGQLGPWAGLVQSIGIDPNSTLMKYVFVTYGAAWLIVMGFFISGARWSAKAMLILAIGSLWYLLIGTVTSVIQIVCLSLLMRRNRTPPVTTLEVL